MDAEVDAFGPEQWEEVARLGSSGRSGHECATQWGHRLRPSLNLSPWSQQEDAKLVKLQARHGMHRVSAPRLSWGVMLLQIHAQMLHTRPDSHCLL